MIPPAVAIRCPHCNAELPDREIAEGWCDSCGKRLPLSYRKEDKRAPGPLAPVGRPSGQPSRRRLGLGAALALLATLAALILLWRIGAFN